MAQSAIVKTIENRVEGTLQDRGTSVDDMNRALFDA